MYLFVFVFVFLIVSLVPAAQQSVVRSFSPTDDPRSNAVGYLCSNETSQAWLHIVFVIDTSDAMSRRNFNALVGQISTFMQPFTFGQTEKHTIRVAVITYGINVVERYLLTDTTDFDNFIDFLKPLIILFAAAYDKAGFNGADKTANAIKNNGINIVVINFASSDGVLTNALEKISSPGFYYVSNQDNINSLIPFALTQINCFCPPGYIQFRYYNTAWKNYTNYAECLFGFSKWKWWGYNETEYTLGNYPSIFDIPNKEDNYGYFWNHYGFNWTLQTGYNLELPYICQLRACDAEYICDQRQAKKMLEKIY
uniref:VWFA domain-containing protein n=1 Tax=Panagrolaimus sp. PS1159 TaxID=55785 RepID=A0AC35GFB9_9BILA